MSTPNRSTRRTFWAVLIFYLLIALIGLGMIGRCHSGEKMTEQQAERYESIPDDEKEGEKQ